MGKQYGNWQISHELGQGGQGVVYKAFNVKKADQFQKELAKGITTLNSMVDIEDRKPKAAEEVFRVLEDRRHDADWYGALKVLRKPYSDAAAYEKARKRLHTEIVTISGIEHPNLIPVLDSDPFGEWVVFKYYDQGSMRRNLGRFKGQPVEAARAFLGLVDAVHMLHRADIIHRDIKPDNIFLEEDGRLVLGDLGLVFVGDEHRATETDEKVGTTAWMPTWAIVEQRLDEVTQAFDVFSLGKILWAMISGDQTLQLHYVLTPKFDLTERFTGDPRMKLVNKFLAKCIVEYESDCVATTADLLVETRELLRDLEYSKAAVCPICKQENWEKLNQSHTTLYTPMITVVCRRCGYVRTFASEASGLPSWVKKVTKIRPEMI